MSMSEKGDNSVKYLQNFAKSKLYAIYHDPSLSGYPDIVVTRSVMGKMPKSEKVNNSIKYSQNFTKS